MTEPNLLFQYLVAGERLLFYSKMAELIQPLPLYGSSGSSRASSNIRGMLAVTDKRLFILEEKGFLSLNREFEAIFSSDYARQLIKEATAKNDALKQQAMQTSIFSRNKWLKQHGYRVCVDILTEASLEHSVRSYTTIISRPVKIHYGKENLFLQLYHAYPDSEIKKTLKDAGNAWMSKDELEENLPGASDLLAAVADSPVGSAISCIVSSTHELRIKKPLIMAAGVETMDFASVSDRWLMPIIQVYKGKTKITYEPILEIMQAKAQEISEYIKEYENEPV